MTVIKTHEVCNEMLDVLEKHKIPMCYLDRVLIVLKDMALSNTLIQNIELQKEDELKKIKNFVKITL